MFEILVFVLIGFLFPFQFSFIEQEHRTGVQYTNTKIEKIKKFEPLTHQKTCPVRPRSHPTSEEVGIARNIQRDKLWNAAQFIQTKLPSHTLQICNNN